MLLCAKYVITASSPHIDDGAVLVEGDRIVAVGTRAELVAAHPDEEVRDFGLAVLTPGFVDLHTHLEYSVFRGAVDDVPYTRWKMQVVEKQKRLARGDWQDSAVLGAMESLQSGITTIADITNTGSVGAGGEGSRPDGIRVPRGRDDGEVEGGGAHRRRRERHRCVERGRRRRSDRDRYRAPLAVHVPPRAVRRRGRARHRARHARRDPPRGFKGRVRLRPLRFQPTRAGLPRAGGLARRRLDAHRREPRALRPAMGPLRRSRA